ncbi:MAG: Rrf2 family transcriptional regulator [Verrucomicrobiota bacterium]
MKVSKKAEYALQAVLAIARAPKHQPIQIQELAEAEDIPVKFLEQILLTLKKGQLLQSKRGVGGGYQLNRSPSEISVGNVIRLIDGDFIPIDRVTEGSPNCSLTSFFTQLQEIVDQHLDDHTIEDLLAMERPKDVLAFEI